MRPLVYSEKEAAETQTGWIRTGHHISYTRNLTNNASPLLSRCVPYHMLEWQMVSCARLQRMTGRQADRQAGSRQAGKAPFRN